MSFPRQVMTKFLCFCLFLVGHLSCRPNVHEVSNADPCHSWWSSAPSCNRKVNVVFWILYRSNKSETIREHHVWYILCIYQWELMIHAIVPLRKGTHDRWSMLIVCFYLFPRLKTHMFLVTIECSFSVSFRGPSTTRFAIPADVL